MTVGDCGVERKWIFMEVDFSFFSHGVRLLQELLKKKINLTLRCDRGILKMKQIRKSRAKAQDYLACEYQNGFIRY